MGALESFGLVAVLEEWETPSGSINKYWKAAG